MTTLVPRKYLLAGRLFTRLVEILRPGSNVTLTADEAAGTITVASTGGGGGGATQTLAQGLFLEDGVDGERGPPGDRGPAGATGATGATGPAVYLDADQGPDGDIGPPGPIGPTGAAGATGAQGPAGPAIFLDGDQGPEGDLGMPGPPGPAGATGTTGAQGPMGPALMFLAEDGVEGERGPPGPTGAAGAPGGGGGGTATVVETDVGSKPVFAGKFTITDAGITSSSKILVFQHHGPYTGKGTRADEADMDPITATATPGTGSAVVRWQTVPRLTARMITQSLPRALVQGNVASADDRRHKFEMIRLGRVRKNIKFVYQVFA